MTDNNADQADQTLDQNGAVEQGDAGKQERTFTQADIDRLMKIRVGEALNKQKAQFADYDALKERASKLDEIEEAQKTELQKANDRAEQLEKKATEAAARVQEALLRSAVISEAARKNVVDPDAVLALLDRTVLEFDDAGTPKNIGDAIDSLLEAKPYLAGNTRPAGSADLGARGSAAPGQLTREDLAALSAAGKNAEILQAKADGRLADVLGQKT